MSVEPSESETWTRWQGHIINDVFTLGRCLGCSDHSGVFLTQSAALGPSDVAIKLVPAGRALAESQLPRWKRAGGIAQPHLLRMLQWGGCQLDGLPYLYVVMEFADQTLAQVLQRRALTDDEALEMLRPTLDALAFLHAKNLVQGQLKPTNVLAVGDELKLASDTIRRVSDGAMNPGAPTPYDPPEARDGSSSTAGDIWALGVCLFEALTGLPPAVRGERSESVALPPDFSPAFRDIVARCLSPSPQERPSATELVTWARGQAREPAPEATVKPAAIVPPAPTTPAPAPAPIAPAPAAPAAVPPAPLQAEPRNTRSLLTAVLGAAVVLALLWTGIRMVRSHRSPAPLPAAESSPSQSPGVATPVAADARERTAKASPPKQSRNDPAASPSTVLEVIPEVPQSARRTITGHINVWVRVIVAPDGSVFAATADRSGPSMYFQRLAIDAARKWTFPPVDTQSRRLMEIRFDFSRDRTTGRAVALQ
jgi:TonB family protein